MGSLGPLQCSARYPRTPHFFKLYALDKVLDLKPDAGKAELVEAMKEHILAEGQLMGTYKRSRYYESLPKLGRAKKRKKE